MPTKEEVISLDMNLKKDQDTKKKSLSEALANLIPGYWIAFALNMMVLPMFAADMAIAQETGDYYGLVWINTIISIIYTVFSIVRQYTLRRAFIKLGPNENFYTLFKRIWCWKK